MMNIQQLPGIIAGLCLCLLIDLALSSGYQQPCCTLGHHWLARNGGRTCPPYHLSGSSDKSIPWGSQAACNAVVDVCCLHELHRQQCWRGQDAALSGATCNPRQGTQPTSDAGRECCSCCLLGTMARDAGSTCEAPDHYSERCRGVYSHCCDWIHPPTPPPIRSFSNTPLPPTLLLPRSLYTTPLLRSPGGLGKSTTTTRDNLPSTFSSSADRLANKCSRVCHSDESCVLVSGSHYRCLRGQPHSGVTRVTTRATTSAGSLHDYERTRTSLSQSITYRPNYTTANENEPQESRMNVEEQEQDLVEQDERCAMGYEYSMNTARCRDIDECATRNSCRAKNMICRNSLGSYTCHCDVGYQFNPRLQTCADIDECGNRRHTCKSEEEICENTVGSFLCRSSGKCRQGFTRDERTQTCVDIDECSGRDAVCPANTVCVNAAGSFSCRIKPCEAGHRLDRSGSCFDINECKENPNACPQNSECKNSVGSFVCRRKLECSPGFEVNQLGTKCEDINECVSGKHKCTAPLMSCVNRPGTHLCQCPSGYQINHALFICEDVDECATFGGQVCAQNARCENTLGSFRCLCQEGFELELETNSCRDIDECREDRIGGSCQQICHNTLGSYYCVCREGYQLSANGYSCSDIDECNTTSNSRTSQACVGLCQNVPGSYLCVCPRGYQMNSDGRTCQDIDECSDQWPDCPDADDICINTRGSYKCQTIDCPAGFLKAPRAEVIRSDRSMFTTRAATRKRSNAKKRSYGEYLITSSTHLPHNFIRGVYAKPLPVYASDDSGVICQKVECGANDISCILNLTKSIQWQYIALPSIPIITDPQVIISVQTVSFSDISPPTNHYSIVGGNQHALFDVVSQSGTDHNTGSIRLLKPLVGPAEHLLMIQVDNKNKNNIVISQHIIHVAIYVSEYTF